MRRSALSRICVISGHIVVEPCAAEQPSTEASNQPAPLAGIRVLDLSQQIAGPAAAQLLGDQGADVIKVESLEGDDARADDGSKLNSALFVTVNRNKRSIALNLKSPEGLALLKRLVPTADVILQNFRPGVVDRLGIGYQDLKALKEDLIYVSSSGFGQDGPRANDRVYDPVIQAASGLTSIQADETGRPKMMRLLIPDKLTAMTSAQAISTALVQKARTGKGCHIKLAMIDAVVAWEWPEALASYTFVREGDIDPSNDKPPVFMRDMIYQTSDGYLTCGAVLQKEWLGLCDALKVPEWKTDPRFLTPASRQKNRWLRLDMTEAILRRMSTEDALAALRKHQVPVGKVSHPVVEVLRNEQVQHNRLVFEYEHPHTPTGRVRNARPAAQFEGAPFILRHRAPLLGEHTLEVLGELGVGADEVQVLHERGVVKMR